ncbi:MAG: hypothetical protein ACYC46_10470 [Acidobacteriaceae bacterium]
MQRRIKYPSLVVATILAICLPAGSLLAASYRPKAAQAAATPAPARAVGTVKAISGKTLTIAPDNGAPLSAEIPDAAHILRMQPGSMDLKTATPIPFKDIAVGDRVLVRLRAGDAPNTLTALIVIVMKQSDIEQHQEQEKLDWQKRGTGGLVSAVDAATKTITISTSTASGPGKLQIQVSPKTILRRYAADSVKFEDTKPGTFADIHPGDQLRARGAKNAAGTEMTAEEIVSGSFRNIAGTIESLDTTKNTLKVKDLATKKTLTIGITANSTLHKLPERMAEMFARRFKGEASGEHRAAPQEVDAQGAASPEHAGSASMSLSQAITRTPTITLADLKKGDAVMIVATQNGNVSQETAITVLAGVEPILAATPKNSQPASLSAWSIGSDMPTPTE